MLLVILLALSGLNLTLLVLLLSKLNQGGHETKMLDSLQKATLDLTERIVKSSGDTKESVTGQLAKEFQGLSEKVSRDLAFGRQEQEGRLKETTQALKTELSEIRDKVDARLLAIGEQVQNKLDKNIREGFAHFEKVQEHLKKAELQLQGLNAVGSSINELNNLLRLPHLRGSFGEATLENLLADFLPADSYELQKNLGNGERVDALVKFPKASLPIDSKFPRESVLALFDTSDPKKLEAARLELKKTIKEEARKISEKYIKPQQGTMDMALMFLASETLYFEVIRDPELLQPLAKLKVYPVSPNTLAITLKGIDISRQYYEMAQNVEKTITEIQKAKSHFAHFDRKFKDVGAGLEKAQDAFRRASTHLGHYSGAVSRLTGESPEILPEPTAEN